MIYTEHGKDGTGDYIVMRNVDAVKTYVVAGLMGRPLAIAPSSDRPRGRAVLAGGIQGAQICLGSVG
jgi:hypothetical protein